MDRENDAHKRNKQRRTKGENMLELVLSIIVVLGMAGGPVDFSDGCGTDNSTAVSESAN
ncbi:MAG TPA: hypothetical protein VFR78_15120 [Pyrinomonadaceae bacterium]|nr:hypothetical protein [Pyrinomonadaceae bacterium]